jgi:hypothetical protein
MFMGDWLSFVTLVIWSASLGIASYYFGRWATSGFAINAHEPELATSTEQGKPELRIRAAAAVGLLVYILGYFVVSLGTNVGNAGWGRYLVVSFPLMWAASQFVSSRTALRCAIYMLLGSQALLLAAMVLKHFVP